MYLQPLLGTPRFRQRLYGQEGEIFEGSWAQMGGPAELQVETLPCNNDFHKDLLLAVKNGDETQVEMDGGGNGKKMIEDVGSENCCFLYAF